MRLLVVQLPMLADTELADLKPYSQAAVLQLKVLRPILDVEPTTGLTQYSKQTPVVSQ